MPDHPPVLMEFHISRQARDRYRFDQSLFGLAGNVIFANFHAARVFAQKMNARRDLLHFPEQAVRASQINALGLVDEILHFVTGQYRQQRNPMAFKQALSWLYEQIGQEAVDEALYRFTQEFPPTPVYRGELTLENYLEGVSTRPDGSPVPNRELALEELLMLWLANLNPACAPYLELFDDSLLERDSQYLPVMSGLYEFFQRQPPFGPDNMNLIDMLRAPALAHPHSLTGQLEYIRTRWFSLLGNYLYRLLSSLDLIKEEEKVIFAGGGPGPAQVLEFAGLEQESERFSPDRDWMPTVVLLAKNSYVWLDQLSKKYKRLINRLDEIPDEELDALSRWGFTGLWLIGLWERSPASQKIKQLRGNPEAVASAYSLYSYEIAADLGGDEAYRTLRDRAWQRGIRLASDMVPNHMGIDSPWVIEHPDWFINLDYPPFPSYTFNGPNLSWDARVAIFIEDHYYNNSDAAVVFKRLDTWTGSEKYIYHGNDGTSMPWNDTAQLNYLLPEVREAIIQTILHVARKFPIIRFDAAMTLAKKHYQRLWFPQPGSGGDIPSRAEFSLTREQFDHLFPVEFWREVVDRVAQEAPDTLLLAEAFWMMEGYFVRTLGMHRVYNSAFMNMLRDEKNQEYRLVIKNTLEFDPEILKRYVNFMNNPDERTAVDQFGKGDKYFGVATLMVTMPGLPMFGHGQVEGYAEKYGMEFRRAYWDERPDGYLVERHEREIFPLMGKRWLFAQVQNFLLYDFYAPDGSVDEDVFAYSNRAGEERALVLYHNKFKATRGWIRQSAGFRVKGGDESGLEQRSLGEGLGLVNEPDYFSIFRDTVSGLEYIRSNRELHEQGLYAELNAYQYHVFLDFRQVQDDEWRRYANLAEYLDGRGAPSIEETLREIFLQPLLQPFRELASPRFLTRLIESRRLGSRQLESQPLSSGQKGSRTQDGSETPAGEMERQTVLEEAGGLLLDLLWEAQKLSGSQADVEALAASLRQDLDAALSLPAIKPVRQNQKAVSYLEAGPEGNQLLAQGDPATWITLLSYGFTRRLAEILGPEMDSQAVCEQSRTWIDEWLLGKILTQSALEMGVDEIQAARLPATLKLLIGHQTWCREAEPEAPEAAYELLRQWLQDADFQRFIHVNRYQGVLWFNQEAFESLLWLMFAAAAVDPSGRERLAECYAVIERLQQAEADSQYQVEKLLESARDKAAAREPGRTGE